MCQRYNHRRQKTLVAAVLHSISYIIRILQLFVFHSRSTAWMRSDRHQTQLYALLDFLFRQIGQANSRVDGRIGSSLLN